MELKLKILGGSNAGKEVAVSLPEFLIGRADECQLRPKSDTVSRRHAMIELQEAKALIRDLGSRTGTFVNGKPIAPGANVELVNGDVIKIGPIEFSANIVFSVSGKKKPKVQGVADAASRTAAVPEEVDVTQWLQPDDADHAISETIDGSTMGGVLNACDLFGGSAADTKAAADAAADKKSDQNPDQLASDVLKNYLRRR